MKGKRLYLIAMVLVAATLIAFWPALENDFVDFDDDIYVTANPLVQPGLTMEGLEKAFTSRKAANWHPVTWISHMLDVELFGLAARGHHLVSVIWHAAAALLLFAALAAMTRDPLSSAFVAAFFALHPLRVESVAWISERKDVLSGFFWMLSLLAYFWYARRPRLISYLALMIAFALGLMSKPMVVTLPLVLLLLDFWPLGRLRFRRADKTGDGAPAAVPFLRLLIEKVPLFCLSGGMALVTYLTQVGDSSPEVAVKGGGVLSLHTANIALSYVKYLMKTVWPTGLAFFYPFPSGGIPSWQGWLSLGLLGTLSLLALAGWRNRPYLAVGWLWYLITLVPVIGLVQVGIQGMADRYTYLPTVGLAIIVVFGAKDLSIRWRHREVILAILGVALLTALALMTRKQIGYWADSETLFKRALTVTTDNWVANFNLGVHLGKKGRHKEALPYLREAVRIRPGDVGSQSSLGAALLEAGRPDEAVDYLTRTIELGSGESSFHYYNLGVAFQHQDRYAEAEEQYLNALHVDKDHIGSLNNLAIILYVQGRFKESRTYIDRARTLEPGNFLVHHNTGVLALALEDYEEAAAFFRKALSINPAYGPAREKLREVQAKLIGEAP